MKRYMFVRTIVVVAEDEDEAWDKLPNTLEEEDEDVFSQWAIDELSTEDEEEGEQEEL